jgi:hypothetical protein
MAETKDSTDILRTSNLPIQTYIDAINDLLEIFIDEYNINSYKTLKYYIKYYYPTNFSIDEQKNVMAEICFLLQTTDTINPLCRSLLYEIAREIQRNIDG